MPELRCLVVYGCYRRGQPGYAGPLPGKMPVMTTPVQLDGELGVPAMRRYLRREFSRSEAEKGQRWEFDDHVADAVREHFRSRPAQ